MKNKIIKQKNKIILSLFLFFITFSQKVNALDTDINENTDGANDTYDFNKLPDLLTSKFAELMGLILGLIIACIGISIVMGWIEFSNKDENKAAAGLDRVKRGLITVGLISAGLITIAVSVTRIFIK